MVVFPANSVAVSTFATLVCRRIRGELFSAVGNSLISVNATYPKFSECDRVPSAEFRNFSYVCIW